MGYILLKLFKLAVRRVTLHAFCRHKSIRSHKFTTSPNQNNKREKNTNFTNHYH